MEKVILIISQLIFSYARTINVVHNSKGLLVPSLVSGTIVKMTWIVSTYLGVNAFITKDYVCILLYLVAGLLGDYLALKDRNNDTSRRV